MKNLTIGKKVGLGFTAILFLLFVIAAMSAYTLNSVTKQMQSTTNVFFDKNKKAQELTNTLNVVSVKSRNIGLFTDISAIDKEVNYLTELFKSKKLEATIKPLVNNSADAEKAIYAEIFEILKKAIPAYETVIKQGASGDSVSAILTLNEVIAPLESKLKENLDKTQELQKASALVEESKITAVKFKAIYLLTGAFIVALFIGSAIALRINKTFKETIANISNIAQKIANGDLTSEIKITTKDEVGTLLTAISDMQNRIKEMIATIKETSDSIKMGSKEVASGSLELSTRTEESASSLQQTASATKQLEDGVLENLETTQKVAKMSTNAAVQATEGSNHVSSVVSTMGEINQSSQKISEIISVIDTIAFQTNILALNAAVEAARAGEQGKGFSVVAAEVRNLAKKSAESSKEIKTLINASMETVEKGLKIAAKANDAMTKIVASSKDVADLMNEVSNAAVEQSAGISQISAAIVELDRITNQNTALVEESAAAASSLQSQANSLNNSIAVFKLKA